MSFLSTSNEFHLIAEYNTSESIKKIVKKVKSGDTVRLMIERKVHRSFIAVLQIDYCNSDRVWWVKPMLVDHDKDELVEPVYSDDHPLFGIVGADHGIRRDLAVLIEEANNAIRDNRWVLPSR
tara:strand:+ start:478 stop:846 length:369 start_codon:yes stop_codon:yes gene_type:complete